MIVVLFVFAAIFWCAFEQAPTSLNLFARDFTDRTIGGFEIPATWFQSINSLFIIILAPVFAALWVRLARARAAIFRARPSSRSASFCAGLGFADHDLRREHASSASGGALKVSAVVAVGRATSSRRSASSASARSGLSSMTKLSPRRVRRADDGDLVPRLGRRQPHRRPRRRSRRPGEARADAALFSRHALFLFIAAAVLALLVVPIKRMMRDISHKQVASCWTPGDAIVSPGDCTSKTRSAAPAARPRRSAFASLTQLSGEVDMLAKDQIKSMVQEIDRTADERIHSCDDQLISSSCGKSCAGHRRRSKLSPKWRLTIWRRMTEPPRTLPGSRAGKCAGCSTASEGGSGLDRTSCTR